jgi:hypothetical protein
MARRLVPVGRFQVSRLQRPPKSLPGHQIVEPCEPELGELPQLAGLRLPNRADAIVRLAPDHGSIARVAQAHRRHAPGPNALAEVVGGPGAPGGARRVRVHVDPDDAVHQRRDLGIGRQHLLARSRRGAR